jgi:NAD(P)-dependent dehydrogenase (short-subunit alcohol dehydrogenase family)
VCTARTSDPCEGLRDCETFVCDVAVRSSCLPEARLGDPCGLSSDGQIFCDPTTYCDRLGDGSSVVMFGGRAKDRPYPGSTTVTTVNGGVDALIRTLAIELAPVRFNALHPGIVADTPFWENKPLDAVLQRTPTGRLVSTADVVDATVFLLENPAVNGIDLAIDGGWLLM